MYSHRKGIQDDTFPSNKSEKEHNRWSIIIPGHQRQSCSRPRCEGCSAGSRSSRRSNSQSAPSTRASRWSAHLSPSASYNLKIVSCEKLRKDDEDKSIFWIGWLLCQGTLAYLVRLDANTWNIRSSIRDFPLLGGMSLTIPVRRCHTLLGCDDDAIKVRSFEINSRFAEDWVRLKIRIDKWEKLFLFLYPLWLCIREIPSTSHLESTLSVASLCGQSAALVLQSRLEGHRPIVKREWERKCKIQCIKFLNLHYKDNFSHLLLQFGVRFNFHVCHCYLVTLFRGAVFQE